MSDHLLRQRRNLIITCLLLLLLKYGDITISKISIAGFEIAIKNPEALTVAIWVAFFYFLYRYAQYFIADGLALFMAALDAALEEKCDPIIRAKVDETYPEDHNKNYSGYKQLKLNGWIYNGLAMGNGSALYPSKGPVIKRSTLWREIAQAYFHTIVVHNVTTDYILPFLLAAFVLLYYGWGMLFA